MHGFNASIGKYGYSVAYSAPVECKTGNNARIIGNLKRIVLTNPTCWYCCWELAAGKD